MRTAFVVHVLQVGLFFVIFPGDDNSGGGGGGGSSDIDNLHIPYWFFIR